MRTAAICPTCATYTNAVCVLYDGPYLSNLDIAPLTDLEEVIGIIDAKVGTLQPALGFTPENVANKSTSTSLGTSNTLYPTQNAVKTYVDTAVAAVSTPTLQQVTDAGLQTNDSIKLENGFDIYDSANTQWIEVRGGDNFIAAKIAGALDYFLAEVGNLGIGDGTGKFGIITSNLIPASTQKFFNLPAISGSSATLVTSVNGIGAGGNGNVNLGGYTGSIVVGLQTLNFTNGILTSVV